VLFPRFVDAAKPSIHVKVYLYNAYELNCKLVVNVVEITITTNLKKSYCGT